MIYRIHILGWGHDLRIPVYQGNQTYARWCAAQLARALRKTGARKFGISVYLA